MCSNSLVKLLKPSLLPSFSYLSLSTSASARRYVRHEVNNEGIATVVLDRKPVNSMNREMLEELSSTLAHLESSGARGLVLTSAQDTVFSAGLDITEVYKPKREKLSQFWSSFQDCWLALYSCKLPTAAAVTGHSPAGGCVLAMSCDFRVMRGDGKFRIGLNETQLGMSLPYWVKDLSALTIGQRQTELALQLGSMHTAQEALQLGLVDEVAAGREECIDAASRAVTRLAKIPAQARHMTKMMMRSPLIDDLTSRKKADIDHCCDSFAIPSVQENIGRYLEAMQKQSKKKLN